MKATYLPLAAAVFAISSGAWAADSEFKIYGKANLSLNNTEVDSDDQWDLNSNASRLGFKGNHKVNDDLEFIYKMEYEVFIDDGDKGGRTFSQRNIFAGVKGSFGTFLAGRHDTPLKMVQGKVDRFSDLAVGDMKNYVEGEDRVNNILMYKSPTMIGFGFTLAVVPGEGEEVVEDSVTKEKVGLADGVSFSAAYKNDWVKAAIAHNSEIDMQDTTRLVADFSFGSTTIGFLAQQAELVDGSAEEDSFLLSGIQKMPGDWALKVQLGMTDYSDDSEHFQFAVGVDKKLDKKSKLYAYISNIEEDTLLTGSVGNRTVGAGYEIKF